jgi:hypothetical protein
MRAVLLRRLLTVFAFGSCLTFLCTATHAAKPALAISISHRDSEEGWAVAESDNFLIYHRRSPDYAENMAHVAEKARETALLRWFGEAEAWPTRCAIYLYGTSREYQLLSGAPAASPAHTQVRVDRGRVLSRSIHLHGERPEVLRAMLPHEVTHAVLAGHFGDMVPRWADEGMAVLNEPRDRIDAHLRDLRKWRDERRLFVLHDLMEMRDYPPPRQIGAFYAQSVSLVEFLAKQKDTATVTRFVREGQRRGYATALKDCYGWDFDDLESRWRKYAFAAKRTDE